MGIFDSGLCLSVVIAFFNAKKSSQGSLFSFTVEKTLA